MERLYGMYGKDANMLKRFRCKIRKAHSVNDLDGHVLVAARQGVFRVSEIPDGQTLVHTAVFRVYK